MKKHVREILNDLKRAARPRKTLLDVAPRDLNNQILSKDQAQRVRQLDQQAQESEQRQTLS